MKFFLMSSVPEVLNKLYPSVVNSYAPEFELLVISLLEFVKKLVRLNPFIEYWNKISFEELKLVVSLYKLL